MNIEKWLHLQNVDAIRFKKEVVEGEEFTIVCYMVADSDVWKLPMALESRGHVFDKNGKLVSAPFEKFFNYRENEYTQPEKIKNLKIKKIYNKVDGSLITPVLVKDSVYWKSKKSFYSDVVTYVNKSNFDNYKEFSKILLENDITPIFEFTCPENRVVIDYGQKPQLTLLALRDNVALQYYDLENFDVLIKKFNIKVVEEIKFDKENLTIDELENDLKTKEDIEGYVLVLENGMRVKLKTPWYLRLHKLMTVIRERDIAEMVANETVDDIKSSASLDGLDLQPILNIEKQVVSELENIWHSTKELYKEMLQYNDRKEIANKFKNNPYFGLAIKLLDNKEPDIKKYWMQHYLKKYSLQPIYNKVENGE